MDLTWAEHLPATMAWLRFVYTPLAALGLYVMYRLCHVVRRAIATGVARPSKRRPALLRAQQPLAYWSYVVTLSALVIPALALAVATLIVAVLRKYPPQF